MSPGVHFDYACKIFEFRQIAPNPRCDVAPRAPKGKDEESYEEAKEELEEELDQAAQSTQGGDQAAAADPAPADPAPAADQGVGDPWEYDWAQLAAGQKSAALMLGFDESKWDGGKEAPVWGTKRARGERAGGERAGRGHIQGCAENGCGARGRGHERALRGQGEGDEPGGGDEPSKGSIAAGMAFVATRAQRVQSAVST